MSIVALKRKSYVQYGKGHVDKNGVFSLNGPYRHPPPTLGRAVFATPMKGSTPMGHGCGRSCRLPGRYARICGGKYTPVVHHTGEILQTDIHPSVQSESVHLDRVMLKKQVVKRIDKDASHYANSQRNVILHTINTAQVCPPFYKDVGPLTYTAYMLRKTQCL